MGTNKYIYIMVGLVGVGMLLQVFGLVIEFVSHHQRGMLIGKLSTVAMGLFVLTLGFWFYREKRDGISSVFFFFCTAGFVFILTKIM